MIESVPWHGARHGGDMGHDVFISYGSPDKLVADAACARLEAHGIRCWIAPRDLIPGQSYAEGITEALRNCRVLVLVFSANANLSTHVGNEVERAVHNNVPIIPFRIEAVKPTGALEFFIASVHWLDALTEPMEQHLESLAHSVQRLLGMQRKPHPIVLTPVPPPPVSTTRAPVPESSRRLHLLVAAIALALIGLVVFKTVFGSRADPRPAAVAASTDNSPPRSPSRAPGAQEPLRRDKPEGVVRNLTGCWLYNNFPLTVADDGRVIGLVEGGKWTDAGNNRYVITWPPVTDTVVLSSDGQSLSGSNNFAGPVVSAQRSSGEPRTFVGTWRWMNGLTTVVNPGGTASAGTLQGKWTQLGNDTFRVVWNFAFVDRITLSKDGRTLSGSNQGGTRVNATRTPCPSQ